MLDKEIVEQIKGALRKSRAEGGHFLYCQSGADGDPVLLVSHRKIPGAEVAALKRSAQKKKFVRGKVRYNTDAQAYVFSCLAEPLPAFARDVKRVFARQIRPLKGALVEKLEMDESERQIALLRDAQETASEAEGGLSDLRAEAGRLDTLLAQLDDQARSAKLAAEAELGYFASEEEIQEKADAQQRLDALLQKKALAAEDLEEARADIEVAAAEAQIARADADDLLTLWDQQQQDRWSVRVNGTDAQSVAWRGEAIAQTVAYARAAEEYDAVTAQLTPIEAEHAVVSELAQEGHKELEALQADLEATRDAIARLEQKEPFTDDDAAELSQAEMQARALERRIPRLDAAITAAQARAPELDDEMFILARRQERARVTRDIAMAHQQIHIATRAERDLRSVQAMELIEAEGSLRVAHQDAEEAAALLAEAEQVSKARIDADAAVRAAQQHLHLIQADLARAEALADTVSMMGWWEDPDKIDLAKAEVPQLQAEKAEALRLLEAAQEHAEAAYAAAPAQTKQLVAARKADLVARLEVARADRQVARCQQEHADEDARIASVAADVSRRAKEERVTALMADSPALQAVQASADEAEAATAAAMAGLASVDGEVEQIGDNINALREKLRAAGSRRAEIPLLEALRDQLGLLARLERRRDEARAVLEAALQMKADAAEDFAAQVQVAGDADPELGALLDAVTGAERLEAEAREKSAAAIEAVAESDAALDELDRQYAVVRSRARLEALVISEDTRALIEQFHHMADDGDISAPSLVLDMLDEDDKAKAKAMPGYADLVTLQQRLDRRALSMLRAGATAEELDVAFAQIPNGLRPPSYRAEVAAFVTLDQAFEMTDDEKAEAQVLAAARGQVLVEERKAAALKKLQSLATDGDAVAAARMALNQPAVDEDPSVLDGVMSALGSIEQAIRTAEAGTVETFQDLHEVLADSMLLLKHANLDVVAILGPALTQLLGPARDTYDAAMEAAVRRGLARHTGLIAKAAKVAGSPLAGAFEEAIAQENALWAKYSVDATMSAAQIVGRLSFQFPGKGAIAAALELGAHVGKSINEAAFTLSGWRTAQRAKTLLEEARAGSEVARVELFKTHPLYAKGLIAYMARQDDPFARRYLDLRTGGTEETDRKIKADSLRILTHYLLKSAEQLDLDGDVKLETAAEWCERQRARLVESITAGFKGIQDTIDRWREIDRFDDQRLTAIHESTHELDTARQAALRLKARYADDASVSDAQRDAIDDLLARYRDAFAATRREAMAGLTRLELLERRAAALARHQDSADDATRAAAARLERAVPEMRDKYLDIVGILAKAA